jgi:GMP synthase-like glutamine amidotransferase
MKPLCTPIKVGILQCDEVPVKLQPRFGLYQEMIQQMFAGFAKQFQLDVFDCRKNEYPDDIFGYSFFITTGSRVSVYEKKPWIHVLIDFVRELDRQKIKLIGICFGHQIIGMACNGKVENPGKGWGIGVAVNRVLSTPEWMKDECDTLNILVSHQDQVTMLPEGAVVIAASNFCPYFVVQWNEHFFSIQGHPEWNKDYSRALMNERRSIISPERIEKGFASLEKGVDSHTFVRWIMGFISK